MKRFLMANFPWCALAFLIELRGTLLSELLEALFLLLYATFLPLRGVALLFVLGLAVGHLLHRAGGAVLGRALVLELIGTNLRNKSFIIQLMRGETNTCTLVVVH